MATLRDALYSTTAGLSDADALAVQNANKGELRRGFETGRLTTEINALAANEASLRAAGRVAEADGLRAQIAGLQASSGAAAPRVQSLRDIHGVGDALDYAAGAVGQGAASMVDPAAAATALAGVGKLASMAPNPVIRGLGKAAEFASPLAAYGINQRQLKGEFYNDAMQDPVVAAQDPSRLNTTAELYGAGAGLLDTVLPGLAARRLAGLGTGALSRLPLSAKVAGDLVGEGLTETGQELGKQVVLGRINPNRDTGGDDMALADSFVGGALGAGPFSVPSAMAEAGHHRAAGVVGALGDKAGQTFDLASGALQGGAEQAKEGAKSALSRALGRFKRGGESVDLGEGAPDAPAGFSLPPEHLDAFGAMPPEGLTPEENVAWFQQNLEARRVAAEQHLGAMGDDPEAQALRQRMSQDNPDFGDRLKAVDDASDMLMRRHEEDALAQRAARGSNGEVIARALGGLAAKGLKKAGQTAVNLGKAAFEGATQSKKNLQDAGPDLGKMFGGYLADELNTVREPKAMSKYMSGVGETLGDLVSIVEANAKKFGKSSKASDTVKFPPMLASRIDSIARDMRAAFGGQAVQKLDELQAMAGGAGKQVLGAVKDIVQQPRVAWSDRIQAQRNNDVALSLIKHASPEAAQELAGSADARRGLVNAIDRVATGQATPAQRNQLERALGGPDRLKAMLSEYSAGLTDDDRAEVSNGGGKTAAAPESDLVGAADDAGADLKAAAKSVEKGAAPRLFAFDRSSTLRSDARGEDPFKAESTKDDDTGDARTVRPHLFPRGRKLFDGVTNAVDKRIEDVLAQLTKAGEDGRYEVKAVPASELIKERGMQPAAVMAMYRDYLRQEAKTNKHRMSEEEHRAAMVEARDAARMVLDMADGSEGDAPRKTASFRLAPERREQLHAAAKKFFGDRDVVVAQQLSERVPDRIELPELSRMTRATKKAVDTARDMRNNNEDWASVFENNNLLTFRSAEGNKPVRIRADDLVAWARKQRLGQEASDLTANASGLDNRHADKQYLSDLSSGIAALMSSGHVGGEMPTMIGRDTKGHPIEQSFKDGVPPALRLATTTQEARAWSDKQRAVERAKTKPTRGEGGDARTAEDNQERVAQEQARENTADVDTPPADDAPLKTTVVRKGLSDVERMKLASMSSLGERMAYLNELEKNPERVAAEDVELAGVNGAKFNPVPGSTKTGDTNVTPLDFFDQIKKPEMPDEFDDQRYQSRVEGFDAAQKALPPENKFKAIAMAPRKGDELIAKGVPAIEQRVRSAERTSNPKDDPHGLVGGPHYAFAAAWALGKEASSRIDMGPDEARRLPDLRARVAAVASKMSPKDALQVTRWMLDEDATLGNYRKLLAGASGAEPGTEQSKGLMTNADVLKAVETGEAGDLLPTKAHVDEFLTRGANIWRKAKEALPALREQREKLEDAVYDQPREEAEKPGGPGEQLRAAEQKLALFTKLDGMFGDESYDLGSWYDGVSGGGRTDAEVRAMLAAPEVAAQAPKSSAALDGARARNAQTGAAGADNSQTAMVHAKEYLHKVLPDVRLEFKQLTGFSGEWIEADNLVNVSVTSAPGVLQTTYHEAMHAFFSKFLNGNPEALRAMRSLAENQRIMDRVYALLHGFPAAQAQLTNGEERLAYIYQFWAAGLLELPKGRPATVMEKVRKFIRRVMGRISDSERATEILQAFHAGEFAQPSAAGQVIAKVMAQGTMNLKYRRKFDRQIQAIMAATTPAENVLARSVSPAAQALAKKFFTNPGEGELRGEPGYLNARRTTATQYNNQLARIIDRHDLSEKDMVEVTKLLEQQADLADIHFAPHREAVKDVRKLLRTFYHYMAERGLTVADSGEKYFPTVWSFEKLIGAPDKFVNMLTTKYGRSASEAAELYSHMTGTVFGKDNHRDPTKATGVLNPFFAGKESIELPWMEQADKEQFLEKDLISILSTYFHRGARAAEYAHRFGEDGKGLEQDLQKIGVELRQHAAAELQAGRFGDQQEADAWAARQQRAVANATGAMEGSLGKDISPTWRKASSWMTAYQNLRLLPLCLFASFVDPLGMVARGGTMREAYDAFLRGMREVFANWRNLATGEHKESTRDRWVELAEQIGAVDAEIFGHHVSEEYSSGYMAPGAKRVNDWLFRVNGMESWNRGMRAGATKGAVHFLERHAKLPEIHSERWLRELGLTPADVRLNADGTLALSVEELQGLGLSRDESRGALKKLHDALNRWVEGAILTPNAAQRPSWSSDPRWSFFFHLKQFAYSFHQTILKRAVNEMNYGNMAPIGTFLWYIPAMIAADVTKGLVQGGGTLPSHMQGMELGDWVMRGAERAGFLGIGSIGVDAGHDIWSLAGPGAEQMIDAVVDPAGKTVLKALPLNPLYANMVS